MAEENGGETMEIRVPHGHQMLTAELPEDRVVGVRNPRPMEAADRKSVV